MNAKKALKISIDSGSLVAMGYLADLTDEELMVRPCPGCNHINWQVGHLIWAEHRHMGLIDPGFARPLPHGFAEKYGNDTASLDDPKAFCTKAELLQIAAEQRAATLAALEKIDEADLDRATGLEWAPTVADLFSMQGSHWLMHAGQWAVIRRQLGRPPLF